MVLTMLRMELQPFNRSRLNISHSKIRIHTLVFDSLIIKTVSERGILDLDRVDGCSFMIRVVVTLFIWVHVGHVRVRARMPVRIRGICAVLTDAVVRGALLQVAL